MANQFQVSCIVDDAEIAEALFNDAELFACVFHEMSEKGEAFRSGHLEEVAEQMSPQARAMVRELAAKIELVEVQP